MIQKDTAANIIPIPILPIIPIICKLLLPQCMENATAKLVYSEKLTLPLYFYGCHQHPQRKVEGTKGTKGTIVELNC